MEATQQPAVQQEGGITRGQEGSARGGNATTSFFVFCHAILAIRGVVVYCGAMVLRSVVVRRTAMSIHSVVFGCVAMAIGGVSFLASPPWGYVVSSSAVALWWLVSLSSAAPHHFLSSATPPLQFMVNTTISQKRDAQQRFV